MKPEFYVIRLGRAVDPNKPVVGELPALNIAQAAPRRARDLGQRPEREPEVQVEEGYGQELARSELKDPVIRFTTAEAAEKYAQSEAMKHPKVAYAVLGVLSVFETLEPTVIEKRFNNKGELVLSDSE